MDCYSIELPFLRFRLIWFRLYFYVSFAIFMSVLHQVFDHFYISITL